MATKLSQEDLDLLKEYGIKVKGQEDPHPLGSFARNALRATPSTAAGIAIGGRTPGPPIAKLLSGIAGSFLTDQAIEAVGNAVVPKTIQKFNKQLEEDMEKNKLSSLVGQFAPGAMAFGASMKLPKAIGDLLKNRKAASAASREIIKNAAVASGTEAGVDASLNLAIQGAIDPQSALLSALSGGVLNQPTRLGRALMGGTGTNRPRPVNREPKQIADYVVPSTKKPEPPTQLALPPAKETLLLEDVNFEKLMSDTIMIDQPDGTKLIVNAVPKPSGLYYSPADIVVEPGRKVMSPKRKGLKNQVLKELEESGFNARERQTFTPKYAESLKIGTGGDLLTSAQAAAKKSSPPLLTAIEKQGLVPVKAEPIIMPEKMPDTTDTAGINVLPSSGKVTRLPEKLMDAPIILNKLSAAKAAILSGEVDPAVIRSKLAAQGASVEGKPDVDIVSDALRANHGETLVRGRIKNYTEGKVNPPENDVTLHWGIDPSNILKGLWKVVTYPTKSAVDKLATSGKLIDSKLAPLFKNTFEQATRLFGEFNNIPMNSLRKYSNTKLNRVWQYMNDIADTGQSVINLDADERAAHKVIQQAFTDVRKKQNDMGLPVKEGVGNNRKFRQGNINPDYVPFMMNAQVIELFTRGNEAGDAIKTLQKQFVDWHVNSNGLTADKANSLFDEILDSFRNLRQSKEGTATNFGPLDKAEGIGIPPEWRDMNFKNAFRRYNSRAAKRLAFFDNMERHAWVRQHLRLNNPYTGEMDDLDEFIPGTWEKVAMSDSDFEIINPLMDILNNRQKRTAGADILESTGRLVKSAILGPVTGARDLLTGATIGFQHLTPQQVPSFLVRYTASSLKLPIADAAKLINKTMRKVGAKDFADFMDKKTNAWLDDWEKTLAKGVNSYHVANIENIDGLGRTIEYTLNAISDGLNKVQLRTMFDQMARTGSFTAGRWAIHDMVRSLNSKGPLSSFIIGKKQMRRQLEIFAGSKAKADKWINSGYISEADLDDAAAKFVESTQGTYGANGLPLAAINNGSFSGPLSLARWSIEKFNNFDKYVVQEAREGNWLPAVMQIGGSIIGGAAMNSLIKEVTGKEPIIPEYDETIEALEQDKLQMDDMFYILTSYAQMAGLAGLGGEMVQRAMLAKRSSSAVEGALSFVAFDEAQAIQQGLSDMLMNATRSDISQEERAAYFVEGLNSVILRRVQMIRTIKDRFGDKISKEWGIQNRVKNAKRVANRWADLYGYEDVNQAFNEPSLKNLPERRFRKSLTSESIDENLLPALRSVERRTTNEGQSPQTFLNALEGLSRGEASSILPGSITEDPLKSEQFLQFIRNTRGQKGVDEVGDLFLQDKAATKLKKALIDQLKTGE